MKTQKHNEKNYKKIIQKLENENNKQKELIKLLKDEVSDLSCKLSIYRAYYFKFDKDR